MVPADLSDWGAGITPPAGAELLVDPVTGRVLLVNPGKPVDKTHYTALFGPLGAGAYNRSATIDPDPDTIFGQADPNNSGPIHLPQLPAAGTCEWPDSRTYSLSLPADGKIANVSQLVLQAANQVRPLLRLERPDGGLEWVITAKPMTDPDNETRTLVIDGLWLGIRNAAAVQAALPPGSPEPAPVTAILALDGVFNKVTLRNATLDPAASSRR